MPWTPRLDLHLDINGRYGTCLLTSATDSSLLNAPPEIVTADNLPVRVHLWERGLTGALTAVELPASWSIAFAAKPQGSETILLALLSFSAVAGETGVYEGTLNANTAEFIAHLAEPPAGPKIIRGELEITAPAAKRSFQFDIAARPQIYDEGSLPSALPSVTDAITAAINAAAIRYDTAQSLTAPQKAQAQANLGMREQDAFSVSGSFVLDWSQYDYFNLNITGATSLSFANYRLGQTIRINTNNWASISWPGDIVWQPSRPTANDSYASEIQITRSNTGPYNFVATVAPTSVNPLSTSAGGTGGSYASQKLLQTALSNSLDVATSDPVDADYVSGVQSGTAKSITFSRVWNWIKSKLDANLTLGGDKTFSGQLEATGQALNTGNSLVNKANLYDALAVDFLTVLYVWTNKLDTYAATNVGTGSVAEMNGNMVLTTGATAGSSAFLRSDNNAWRYWQRGGTVGAGNNGYVYWGRRVVHVCRLFVDQFSGADTILRVQLGVTFSNTSVRDLQTSEKAIGWKIVNGLIYAQVSDGTAVNTQSTGLTAAVGDTLDLVLDSDGNGNVAAWVNGAKIITLTGGPKTTLNGTSNLCMSVTNGSTAASRRMAVIQQKTIMF